MQIVLRQIFPLGRFHATPWKVNPFDDPYGEWPPSPWRLVRAVVARWYQWARETVPAPSSKELDHLIRALCTSAYRFHLPAQAQKGSPLRQYHPVELEMDPPNFKAHGAEFVTPKSGFSDDLKEKLEAVGATVAPQGRGLVVRVKKANHKKKVEAVLGTPVEGWRGLYADPGLRSYSTSLAQDNYWCMPCDKDGAIWWFLEGDEWTDEVLPVLDRCLERVTYFGRAEAFTRIRRAAEHAPQPNCTLGDRRMPDSVPVLVPSPHATRADIERVTDDPAAVDRSVPPGGCVRYAIRPPRLPAREKGNARRLRIDCRLLQFAVGWNVAPDPRALVRLTARFRGAVLRELLRIKTGDPSFSTWSHVGIAVRTAMADMVGKDPQGEPLSGHRHTEFFAWCEDAVPARLLVWRDGRPFDEDEQTAILRAASRELSWAAAGFDADVWKVRLVPLDRAVSPPPGFDGAAARCWESVTPYVPPRHHLRKGKERARESLTAQIRRELRLRGFAVAEQVETESIGNAAWVSVHVPRTERRVFLGDRRGYWMRLIFPEPVRGPLRLGHSSSFGLGLFRPSTVDA